MDWENTHKRLASDRGSWAVIARTTGISDNQVRRIAQLVTRNPRLDTMQKIEAYYAAQDEQAAA